MIDRVDERGKVFTPRMRKTRVEVEILTTHGRLRGHVHVGPEERVKDMLNSPAEQFLAVTNVIITKDGDPNGRNIAFLALNKNHIITIIPINEPRSATDSDEYPAP